MALEKITDDMNIIAKLDDEPNDVGGLTASELKAKFDQAGLILKDRLNTLIAALSEGAGAENISVSEIEGAPGQNVQEILVSLKALIDARYLTATAEAALALKEDKSVTAAHFKAVSIDPATGVFTFTREDGSSVTIDTLLEKVATNWSYDQASQSLVLTLADGSTQRVSLADFITETEFVSSDSIELSVSGHTVTASIKPGGITDAMLSSALAAALQSYVTSAAGSAAEAAASNVSAGASRDAAATSAAASASSASAASDSAQSAADSASEAGQSKNLAGQSAQTADSRARDSEAWAVGQRGGVDVSEDDPAFQNNAKYYKEQAREIIGADLVTRTEAQAMAGDALDAANNYTDLIAAKLQPGITAAGILKGDGAGGISAAKAGADYQAPLTIDAIPTKNSGNPVSSGGAYSSTLVSADVAAALGLTGDDPTVNDALGALNTTVGTKSITTTYTAAVSTTWTADSTNGGYTQTVTVSGILATDNPIADIVLGTDIDANDLYQEAWALIDRIVTSASSITLYANGDAPTTAFTVQLKVVR